MIGNKNYHILCDDSKCIHRCPHNFYFLKNRILQLLEH